MFYIVFLLILVMHGVFNELGKITLEKHFILLVRHDIMTY